MRDNRTERVTCTGVVYPWHCDHMGHMNVMWYISRFDEATWVLFASIGITAEYIRENDRGMAAVQQNVAYKKELVAGEVFVITSRIIEIRKKVLRFEHQMANRNNSEIAANCELTAVHLNLRTRKSCPFPSEVSTRARAMLRT